MVRLRISAALGVALAMTGCVGDITGPGPEEDAALAAAKAKFTADVEPILAGFCGACHTGMPNIDFMKPIPDVRSAMLAFPGLVDFTAPTASTLLNKGAHSGPALTPDQSATMLDWIELESVAAGAEPAETVETDRQTPMPGLNTVDLSGVGLTGSTLTFLYEPLATGMYLSDIKVTGGTGGVHVVNPLFVIWDEGVAQPDPINRFGNVDLTVLEAQTGFVGGGTAVFVDISPIADVSVHFRVAELADGTVPEDPDGIVGGGCNNVPAFTAQAQAALSANCASCHGATGMPDAIAATDMRLINDLTADGQATVCAQVKIRVNEADPINSGLFLAPNPGSGTAHPFKFPNAGAFDAFRTSVIGWINLENP